jgi:hypothetical protein
MEKSLSDYDQSLEELEKQREQLELVMQKMGTEWEQSGAGIGWMGVLDSVAAATTNITTSPNSITSPLDTLQPPKEERWHRGRRESEHQQNTYPYMDSASQSTGTATTTTADPMTMTSPSGPSPDYLRKLLNVKPGFLMQALQTTPPPSSTSSLGENVSSSSAMLVATPVAVSLCTASPPATPEEYPTSTTQHTAHNHTNTAISVTTTSSVGIAPPAKSPVNMTTAFSELVVSPLGGETKNSSLASTSLASKLTTKPIAPPSAHTHSHTQTGSSLPASTTASVAFSTTAADAAC